MQKTKALKRLQFDRISLETYLGGAGRASVGRWGIGDGPSRRFSRGDPKKHVFGTSGRGAQRHAMGWSYFGNVFSMIFYLTEF